ncbi:MAG: hypothetical protein ACRET2_02320 [Steroidobacteraceae bacterium]
MNAPLHPRRASALAGGLLMLLACLPAAGPARAASPGIGPLLACRNIKADAARLRCFDRRSSSLAVAAGGVPPASTPGPPAPTSPAATPSRPAPAAFDPHQTFGLSSSAILAREVTSGARRESISSITTRITGLSASSDGRMIYRFGNGQLWEELVADGGAPPLKTGDQVKVSRGWLGSYWMQTASGRGCKVQRLR